MLPDNKHNDQLIQINDKKIVYPIFVECSKFTLDPYWHQIFTECSYGKFPRGSGIDNDGQLVYIKGRKNVVISYKLNKTPEHIFTDLKHLFQTELNFKSNRDRIELREELDDICKDLQESFTGGWKQIKRKNIKDPIVRRYVLELKNMYALDNRETEQLFQLLKLGFAFGWIPNDDVVYKDQKIVDISSLYFEEADRVFELETPKASVKRDYKPNITKLSTLWKKHLNRPKNRYIL